MPEIEKHLVHRAGGKCAIFQMSDGSQVHATISSDQPATNATEVYNLGSGHGSNVTASGKTRLMNDNFNCIVLCN